MVLVGACVVLLLQDEKLHDVLGHFQKDFEGGVSAENLGKRQGVCFVGGAVFMCLILQNDDVR